MKKIKYHLIFRDIFIILCMSFLFFKYLQKEETNNILKNTINNNHYLIDSLHNQIDSLYNVIDTLILEDEIWDYNIQNNTTHLLSALLHVESRNNDSAYNASEDAVGCLQIRKTMVDDVNRILKRQKSTKKFHYEDRWNRYLSIQMFDIYCKHYGLVNAEEISRCWNGGPRGINNPATIKYWKKVEDIYTKENSCQL